MSNIEYDMNDVERYMELLANALEQRTAWSRKQLKEIMAQAYIRWLVDQKKLSS